MTDEPCAWCATGSGSCTCPVVCGPGCRSTDAPCPGLPRGRAPGHPEPVAGAPVWCRPCQDQITTSLGALVEDCRLLAPGRVAAPSGDTDRTRHGSTFGSPSPSPAWDLVDEVVRWAVTAEDTLRAHLGHAARPQARRTLSTATAYLCAHATAWLCSPVAVDDGTLVVRLARRVERATGRDRLVHRLPAPCPTCNTLGLARADGDDTVRCRICGSSWSEKDYRRLTLVLTSEATS